MKIIQIVSLCFLASVIDSTRSCIWQINKQQLTHKKQTLPDKKIQSPAPIISLIKESKQIGQQFAALLNKNQKFRSYHPHYLHSYSYPQPITPHLYVGQVLANNHPVFFMKQNKTFEQYGTTDHVYDILYINKQKQYKYPLPHSYSNSQSNHKFIMVLQNENMLNANLQMQIIVYNFGDYLGIINNLGYGQFKAFLFYVSLQGKQAQSLNSLPNDIKIYYRNESSIRNMKQTWMNAQRIRWVGRFGIKIDQELKLPLVFQTLVLQIQYLTSEALTKYKLCFNQYPKINQEETIEQIIERMSATIKINTYVYRFSLSGNFDFAPSCESEAQNQIFRGLTYQYGTITMKNGSRVIPNEPKQLLSYCPSRERFPWGFLWDDGFHCQVAMRNEEESATALKVIKSWLSTITESGWIPREQNRGEERDYLCNCPAFMAKDIRDGNPPTLVLSLHYLSKKRVLNAQNFELHYYQKLKKWYNWFLATQQVQLGSYIFRWHDSILNEGSFNSGMDDFPRQKQAYGHVDCQAWMYMFSQAMADISFSLQQDGFSYLKDAEKIRSAFKSNFIDPQTKLPLDFQKNRFTFSKNYSEHFGYPSILPIAFGLLDQYSEEFKKLMQTIKTELDSGNGLTSISMKSRRYLENNDAYWKGPVWININYLFLKGLFENYVSEKQFYSKLRGNLIKVVCGNLAEKGYFYENYIRGQGSFAHPFTGWTALISIIIKESY